MVLGHIRFGSQRLWRSWNRGKIEIHVRAAKPLDNRIDSCDRIVVSRPRGIKFFQPRQRDYKNRFGNVIEDNHRVVKAELDIGQIAIVVRRVGQFLHIPNRVIAYVTDRAADKRWQFLVGSDRHRVQLLSQYVQWVIGLDRFLLTVLSSDRNVSITSYQFFRRIKS